MFQIFLDENDLENKDVIPANKFAEFVVYVCNEVKEKRDVDQASVRRVFKLVK